MTTKTSTRKPRTTRPAPAPVEGGPAATRHPDGRVMALTPSVYPEVKDDVELVCAADGATHPGRSFALMAKRGSGRGRQTECRAHFTARLERNKEARAAGNTTEPAPHIDAEHVVPKPEPKAATK